MTRELKAVEWTGKAGQPMYFRFSDHGVGKTESYADGEVTVDLDPFGEVIGIELLSGDPANFAWLWKITKDYGLSLAKLQLAPSGIS